MYKIILVALIILLAGTQLESHAVYYGQMNGGTIYNPTTVYIPIPTTRSCDCYGSASIGTHCSCH